MRPPTVRPFEPADLQACVALLAGAHAAARRILPCLPQRFEAIEACTRALDAVLESRPDTWVAERDGAVVGYLAGTRSMPAPDSFGAQYAPPHGISVPITGHALAEGEPAEPTYRALYQVAADHWAADGFFSHQVALRASDVAAREAWFLLGFGARSAFATRATSAVEGAAASGIKVHEANVEELPLVRHFDELESLHHRDSPIFWPHLGRDVATAVEAFQRAALEGDQNPIFIATRDGQPLAMHFVLRRGGFGNPISQPDNSLYLYQAIVEPEAQGSGVGTALLQHTLDWGRGQGLEWLNLHYATQNPSGAPFWQSHGFTPLEIEVERTLDERIAWAKKR